MSGRDESSDDDCGCDEDEGFLEEEENLYLHNMMKEMMSVEMKEHACERIKAGKPYRAIEQEIYGDVDAFMEHVLLYHDKFVQHLPDLYEKIQTTYDHLNDVDDEDTCITDAYAVHRKKLHRMLEPYVKRYLDRCQQAVTK